MGEAKMADKKVIAPELLAEARRLYEQTLAPVDDIAGMVGLSRTNFYKRVRAGGWRGRRAKVGTFQFARAISAAGATALLAPASQPRAEIDPEVALATTQQRLAIAGKMQEVVEQGMEAIKRIMQVVSPADQTEAEHGARTVAHVSRALREMQELMQPPIESEKPADDVDGDPTPRDIDEFRRELARRLRGIIDARRARIHGRLDRPAADPESD
jgi:hypothetical protein